MDVWQWGSPGRIVARKTLPVRYRPKGICQQKYKTAILDRACWGSEQTRYAFVFGKKKKMKLKAPKSGSEGKNWTARQEWVVTHLDFLRPFIKAPESKSSFQVRKKWHLFSLTQQLLFYQRKLISISLRRSVSTRNCLCIAQLHEQNRHVFMCRAVTPTASWMPEKGCHAQCFVDWLTTNFLQEHLTQFGG